MATDQTPANMQQLMNKNQPSMQQQLMNQLTNNMQNLMNPTAANLQKLVNPTPSNLQPLNNPNPTTMQQLTNPAPSHSQPLNNPTSAHMQQLANPNPSHMQQLTNPNPSHMQQLANPNSSHMQLSHPNAMQQLINPTQGHMQQLINPGQTHNPTHMQHPNPTHMQQLMGLTQNGKQLLNKPNLTGVQQLLNKNPTAHQLIKGDRLLFASSDDNAMTTQIQGTHSPDGRAFDVKPLLNIVEDIFSRASPSFDSLAQPAAVSRTDHLDDKIYQGNFMATLESLAFLIDRVASEITYKCSGGGDAHATTMAILNMLSNYTWDAKLVIALAAFAMNYGEFWLIAQNYTTNHLAKSVAILKQLPGIFEHSSMLKPRFDAVQNLITVMVEIGRCVVAFQELPPQYITMDVPALTTAVSHLPIAVYWTIRSIVACASQITNFIGLGHEHMVSTTEAWELSSLAHKLSNMHSHLKNQLDLCYKHIDEKKHMETYQMLLHLFEMAHIDNMRVLKALIYQKDDIQPLVEGTTKRRVSIDVLRRKNVLLLISDLDITQDEISILEQIYNESRQQPSRHESQYEIVWLPILDPAVPFNDTMLKKFEDLQSGMTWYSIYHPSLIDRAVIKFIKQEWKFNKKPILVVLDPQGRIACPNALYMMWIWGSLAFPFTTIREEGLWKEETWRLELLVDGIDPIILNWMQEGRYICLYGGEDMEWIRKFTNTARAVAQAAGIPLGMVYVGKSNPKERVRRNTATIMAEKLSHYWQDLTSVWYFWVRIESMWRSKNQLGKTAENDTIMKEIMTLLSFDSSEGGWAMFTTGTDEMVKAKGALILTSLTDYTNWKDQIQQKGFLNSLRDYLKGLHTEHHCNRLILPGTAGSIPERIVCAECGRTMERYLLYKCCDE